MKFWPFGASRRSMTLTAALVGVLSLAIGAHAALNKRALETGATAAMQPADAAGKRQRLALVIGNSRYPDAGEPLVHPIADARLLAASLRGQGYDVELLEDARRDDLQHSVERLKARVRSGAEVALFFGGFAVQAANENYLLPVDAAIWKESDVRRQGMGVGALLSAISDRGAQAKLVAIDASRRNPYERRFRGFSHGLAPIAVSQETLVVSSADAGKLIDDPAAPNSAIVADLAGRLQSPAGLLAAKDNSSLPKDEVTVGAAPLDMRPIALSSAGAGS